MKKEAADVLSKDDCNKENERGSEKRKKDLAKKLPAAN